MFGYLVRFVHFLIVIFTISVPFLKVSKELYILHAVWCFSLIVHWIFNNDHCGLTMLESYLTSTDIQEGFIYSIISPIYKITSNEIYILTAILMFISLARIVN
jgi:hypothetical protein